MDRPHLRALTGMRFLAAMHVVLFHYAQPHLADWPEWVRNIAGRGYVAVALFFILSGFILSYSYLDGRRPFDRTRFWIARIARIYPVYLLSLVLSWHFFFHNALDGRSFLVGVRDAMGTALATITLTQAWHPATACELNCPGWSLSAEAFFYLTLPFLIPHVMRLRQRDLAIGMGALWGLALVAPFLYVWLASDSPEVAQFWGQFISFTPLVRLPEFLFGVLLGRYFLGNLAEKRTLPRQGVVALAAAAVILVALAIPLTRYDALLEKLALTPLFGILILSLAMGEGHFAGFLATPVSVRLGEASYAVYLLHVPVENWMGYFGLVVAASTSHLLLYLAVTVGLSLLVFQELEEPARKAVRELAERRLRAGSAPPGRDVPVTSLDGSTAAARDLTRPR